MVDAVARQCYVGETRPVTVKQRVQEASVAHPERVEATSETEEATVTRFDGDSDHGGADFVRRRCFGDCSGKNDQARTD